MSLLVESIKMYNRRMYNLDYHQDRFRRTRLEVLGISKPISLRRIINEHLPDKNGLYKCRIIYNKDIQSVDITPYVYPEITTLKIVKKDDVDYKHKWVLRPQLDDLYLKKGEVDEIIIIKNGLVSDAYYYNLVFEKAGIYYTPEIPLLRGTKREKLIHQKKIIPTKITQKDIFDFERVHLINAMTDLKQVVVRISDEFVIQ